MTSIALLIAATHLPVHGIALALYVIYRVVECCRDDS